MTFVIIMSIIKLEPFNRVKGVILLLQIIEIIDFDQSTLYNLGIKYF